MTESNYSFTTKLNGDLLTVRGNTADEFYDHAIKLAHHGDLINALAALQGKAQSFQAGAAPAPTHEQAVATVQQAVPQATVVYDSAPAVAGNVTYGQAPAAPQGGPMREVTDKYGRVFVYNVPGAPQTPVGRGPALLMRATSQSGKPYKKWVDPCTAPDWTGGRIQKNAQWEGQFVNDR